MSAPSPAPTEAGPQSQRAPALPPEERRQAIIEATLPLLIQHGTGITTRQIAEAAGIAEGTIFRVFPDKDTLIAAVVTAAFDPSETQAELDSIDRSLPLEPRLVGAVEIIQRRISRIFQLMTVVDHPPPGSAPDPRRRIADDLSSLVALIEPDRDSFRLEPFAVAQVLRGLTFAGTHPMFAVDGPQSPADIVSLALDGVRATHDVRATHLPEQPC